MHPRYFLCVLLLAGSFTNGSSMAVTSNSLVGETAIPEEEGEVLVGAGDIARCYFSLARLTARLLDDIKGTIFTAGDNVYQNGTHEEFHECYGPTWGRHKHRTRPSPGNHDYITKDAVPYYEYFGDRAGPPGLGYYSFDLGSWHILSLNSNIPADKDSAQMKWLRDDLSKSKHKCTLAYWHHPTIASSKRGGNPRMKEIFAELHKSGADVVIAGHEHMYERFDPHDANGKSDQKNGIRSFIVGTGGARLSSFKGRHPQSVVRFSKFGVIKFHLKETSYNWEFVSVFDDEHRDRGFGLCH